MLAYEEKKRWSFEDIVSSIELIFSFNNEKKVDINESDYVNRL